MLIKTSTIIGEKITVTLRVLSINELDHKLRLCYQALLTRGEFSCIKLVSQFAGTLAVRKSGGSAVSTVKLSMTRNVVF